LKTYKTDRPVNDAVISETKEHILLGGGQEAMSVTTTSGKVGKFETRFFHLVYEEEFGTVKGHFGPINACTYILFCLLLGDCKPSAVRLCRDDALNIRRRQSSRLSIVTQWISIPTEGIMPAVPKTDTCDCITLTRTI
jgi:hypothetical protein